MLEYKSCYDIETGFFNKEIGIQDEDKNEDEDEINDNFIIIPQHSMRETNTKLFKYIPKNKKFDLVIGNRFLDKKEMPSYRKAGNKIRVVDSKKGIEPEFN